MSRVRLIDDETAAPLVGAHARCCCLLLADTSQSMQSRDKIGQLNQGLQYFKKALAEDPDARTTVEVAVVAFSDSARVVQNFRSVQDFEPPILQAAGKTAMGAGILKAIELVNARKAQYKAEGLEYYQPWIFMITDAQRKGMDDIEPAKRVLNELESKNKISFHAIGVEGADFDVLSSISIRPAFKLKGIDFKLLFDWISKSLTSGSKSKVGEQIHVTSGGAVETWTSRAI
jgi:uncharacterized protein YegL